MQRRRLLKLGAGAAALLALAGGGVALVQPGLAAGRLTSAGKAVFEAVARAVLQGSLPNSQPAAQAALQAHMARLDSVLLAFPPHLQSELSQLLSLLSTSPGRRLLAGLSVDWQDASVDALQASFDDMRRSGIAVRQQAYHALRDITNAAFYADASAWREMGYPGPRTL